MSDHRNAVKDRDRRAKELGHVPRPLNRPKPEKGSIENLRATLGRLAHRAQLRRITGR